MTDPLPPGNEPTYDSAPAASELSPSLGQERSASLQSLTAALLECVTPAEVVAAVVDRGIAVLGALAGLVALITHDGQELEIVRTRGYASEVLEKWTRFSVDGPFPLSDVVREGKPLFLRDRTDWETKYPLLSGDIADTFQTSVSLPLAARQHVFGAIHFSFAEARAFTAADHALLDELARQCALALERALLLEEVEAAKARQEFLSRASALLAESLDYQTTLDALARLAVPNLCDWAAVAMVDTASESAPLLNLAVAHSDPAEAAWVRAAQVRYPVDMTQTGQPVVQVISTGKTLFLPDISEEVFRAAARDEEHLRLIRKLNLRSYLCVPLTARGKTLGAVTLATTHSSSRTFTAEAVQLVEDVARRAAVALDNARLFGSVEAAQHRTEAVLESITDAFFTLNPDWQFTYVNREAERVLLRSRGELIGKSIWEAFPAAVGSEFETQYRRAVQDRVTVTFRSYYPPLEAWFDVRAYPSQADTGLSVYFRNVNEERHLEQEREELLAEQKRLLADQARLVAALEKVNARQQDSLHRSEERFRVLVEGVRDYAIFMLDTEGHITTWNAGAERFKGYEAVEIIGHHFSRFYTPEDIARRHPWNELEIAKREGRYEEEGWRVRKDGTHFWANVVITALRNEKGELHGFAKVTRDVTERRLREQELATAQAMVQQRRFLTDILASVTQGRLILCETIQDLPAPLSPAPAGDPIALSPNTLKTVRTLVEEVAAACELPQDRTQGLITAASECAMNAVQHAGGGTARVYGNPEAGLVQIWIVDAGHGIDLSHLPRATLESGFSTGGGGIGHGFSMMIACSKRVYLLTSGSGTTVVLEQSRHATEPAWLSLFAAP